MPGAPHEVIMLETFGRIVPAAVARMPVDDAVRRREFVGRVSEAADQDRRDPDGMGPPGQSA